MNAQKRCGIIGYPIRHSLSPAMHNAAFLNLGLPYKYELLEVKPETLSSTITAVRADFIGINVTIPHKEKVIPLLDHLTDQAQLIKAVNTIENKKGKLVGHNTDGPGFLDSLQFDAKFHPKGKKVVILGAGGAARAVAVSLCQAGIKALTITDIEHKKSDLLVKHLQDNFKINVGTESPESIKLQEKIAVADLLVNTTPAGMPPNIDETPTNIKIPKGILVYDLVYNPPETALLKRAKKEGAKTVSGIGMLIRQGALAFKIFTGKDAPFEIMKKAALTALNH